MNDCSISQAAHYRSDPCLPLLSNLMLNSTLEEKENFLAPVGLAYPFFHDALALLDLNLSSLVFEPGP